MSGYITLLGAEQVQSAGNTISRAADDMRSAAATFDNAVETQRRILDDFICRFEAAIEKLASMQGDKT